MKIDTTEIVNTRFEYSLNVKTQDTIINETVIEYKSGLFKIDKRGDIMITNHDIKAPFHYPHSRGYYSSHGLSYKYFYWDNDNTIDSLRVIHKNKRHKNRDTLLIAIKEKSIFNKVKKLQIDNSTSYYKYSIFGNLKSIERVHNDVSYYTVYKKSLLIKQEVSSSDKRTFEYDKKRRLIRTNLDENDYFTYKYDSKNRIIIQDRHRVFKKSSSLERSVFIYENDKLIKVNEYKYKDGIVNRNKSNLFRSKNYKYKNAL